MNFPEVSIIIATYNEIRNIEALLISCKSHTYPNMEIVVVDSDRTTDDTATIARKYTSTVYTYGNERSVQRNYGVAKAQGKYVLILDADMIMGKNVVSACVKILESNKNIGAVVIPEKSFGESYWARCKALERNCYMGDPNIEAPRFFRKNNFTKASGYNTKMVSGEDWDLHERIKKLGKIGRIDEFIYHNEGKLSLLGDLKKKIYYSQKSDDYIQNNVSNVKQVLNFIFRPAYFRNWKMLISDPVHLPGFIIMKALEFVVGAVVIVSKPTFWRKIVPR